MKARALATADESLHMNMTGSMQVVSAMWLVNTTSVRRTVRVHHVSAGDVTQAGNAMLYDACLAPNSTLVVDVPVMLNVGDELRGRADAAGVNAIIYGIEYA